MAVLNGGYLVQLLFISLLDLVKKGTREMNLYEEYEFAHRVKFWVNTITLGLMRFAIVFACAKYIFN